jgi:enoyl-CoA hydratase
MTEPGKVIVETDGPLIVITINRPEVRNAVDREVAYGVCEAVDRLDQHEDLRVGILTGAGGFFSSGMDLKAFLRGEATRVKDRGILGIARTPPTKPLIAAVEGGALAGGFESVMACDLVVSARDAYFGLPEVKRGLAAAAGGLIRLPRLIPPRVALEAALTGDPLTAEELHRHGLINRLVEPGRALEQAKELAQRIIANAPLAVAASKRVIVEQRNWSDAESFDQQEAITAPVLASADAREGAAAFKEKRRPNWQGK